MPAPVLILGAAVVQAEAVAAVHALGRPAHVLAAECSGPAQELADVVVTLDFTDVDAVTDYARSVGAVAVYSVGSDLAMPVVAEVSERLGLPRLVAPGTAHLCHHKELVRELLAATPGAPGAVAHRAVGAGAALPLPLPVVVKPADAQGQRGLTLVTDEADFPAALEHALAHSHDRTALVEEYVPGPEISVNGYLREGRLVFVGVSDRLVWEGQIGLVKAHVHPSRAASEEDLGAAVEVLDAACRAVGLTEGPVYAQMIVGPAGVRLVEVSPRLDGCHLWRLWRAATGVDLLTTAVAAACGEAVEDELAAAGRPLVPVRALPGEPTTTIEFACLPPGTKVPVHEPAVPSAEVLDTVHYYAPGARVRTVNGRLEKVGYTLRRQTDLAPASGPSSGGESAGLVPQGGDEPQLAGTRLW